MAERVFNEQEINNIVDYILEIYDKEEIQFIMTRHITGEVNYEDLNSNDDEIKVLDDSEVDIENVGTPFEQALIQEAVEAVYSIEFDDLSQDSYDIIVEKISEELDL